MAAEKETAKNHKIVVTDPEKLEELNKKSLKYPDREYPFDLVIKNRPFGVFQYYLEKFYKGVPYESRHYDGKLFVVFRILKCNCSI